MTASGHFGLHLGGEPSPGGAEIEPAAPAGDGKAPAEIELEAGS
jgi:hypothetical protein